MKRYVTFFPQKAGLVWKFFPEEAQTIQTVLNPDCPEADCPEGKKFQIRPIWARRVTF
jgi:hypothetical protein